MQVDVLNGLELGDFSKVVIVGEKLGAQVASQSDEFGINFLFIGEIAVMNPDFVVRVASRARGARGRA